MSSSTTTDIDDLLIKFYESTSFKLKESVESNTNNIIEELTLTDIINAPSFTSLIKEYPLVNTIKVKDYGGSIVLDPFKKTRINIVSSNYNFFDKKNICIPDQSYNNIVSTLDDWIKKFIIPSRASSMIHSDFCMLPPSSDLDIDPNHDLGKLSQDQHKRLETRIDYIKDIFTNTYKQYNNNIIDDVINFDTLLYQFMITRDSIHEFLINPNQPSESLHKKQPPSMQINQDKLLMFNIDYNDDMYPIVYNPMKDTLSILFSSRKDATNRKKLVELIEILFEKKTDAINTLIDPSYYSDIQTYKSLYEMYLYVSRVILGIIYILQLNRHPNLPNVYNELNATMPFNGSHKNQNHYINDIIPELVLDRFISKSILNRGTKNRFKPNNTDYISLSMITKTAVSNIITNAVRDNDHLIIKSLKL